MCDEKRRTIKPRAMHVRNQKAITFRKKPPFDIIKVICRLPQNQKEVLKMKIKNDDESSLSHTKWNCQYHIVFIPKYRRKAIYSKLRSDIGKYIRRLCEYKGVEIVEANACPDHIHMLVKIPPKISISSFMGYLKGKSSLMIFEEHANLKYNYGNRHFWAQGYYVSTVGLNKATIKKYIQEQEIEDKVQDKRSLKEYKDPFTGK